MMILHEPLLPKNPDGPLKVLLIGRVSTIHQNESNIEAGYRFAKDYIEQQYDGSIDFKEFGEQGSGMLVNRKSMVEAIEEIESGAWDIVLMEDASKAYRNPRWMWAFVQDCVDTDVRVIAPGDSLDTADPNWELMMGTAALRHGMHIPDTRRRVRRTAIDSFLKGGMVQKVRFGYRKLSIAEADSGEFGPKGLQVAKLSEWTPTIREMARRVVAWESYESIADWLNEEHVPTGPYSKRKTWNGPLITTLLRDRILCGERTFRKQIYKPIYKTGDYKREENKKPEFLSYECLQGDRTMTRWPFGGCESGSHCPSRRSCVCL